MPWDHEPQGGGPELRLRAAGSGLSAAAAAAVAIVLLAAPAGAQGYDPMKRPGAASSGGYDPMSRPGGREPAEAVQKGNPELGGLPDGPGAEDTFYLCSACHSIQLVTQQRVSDQRWDYLWTWMVEEQGMPEQDAETRERILDYLKTHFSSAR